MGDGVSDSPKVYSIAPEPGMTRNCIDAWSMAFVRADGRVDVCCYGAVVGHINEGLEAALNSPKAMKLRDGLLTGQLCGLCKNCPDKKAVPLQTLHERVAEFLATGDCGTDGI